MFKILVIVGFLLSISAKANSSKWIGEWLAMDKWQSEFTIEIEKDGLAFSDYADGVKGSRKLVDGNIQISWENGKSDFIFIGVMGFQRLHKSNQSSYTSGITKKSSN